MNDHEEERDVPDQISDDVRDFFARFETAGNRLDLDEISGQFAETFMSAEPGGVRAVPKAAFLAALPARERLFASIGATGMRLTRIAETPLDDRYVLVDTEWETEPVTDESLTLSSAYVLHRAEDGSLQVVFYLNHQDIMEVLRERAAQ
ncbi:hypothetical protein [Actinomadura sp. DC4]|uniref:hypothetical protein n=1 Tax=Actinomadura sp. DC4 TaxID=3055069 RepID=UPI0025B0415F|nr:hypothetical protein [Actinomadura sp. DC4]MDN3359566.1 hypothetical protein [Actinomadura sp. DC4]